MDNALGSSRDDFHLGVAVAIIAALVAVVDLVNSRFGDDELKAVEEKVSAYSWFQSKSIKEAVTSGERDTLKALLDAGAFVDERRPAVEKTVGAFDAEAKRYEAEKTGILDNARELDKRAAALDRSGDVLDLSELFLHLALLLGGVGVAVQHKAFERVILKVIIGLGALGVAGFIFALLLYARG